MEAACRHACNTRRGESVRKTNPVAILKIRVRTG